MELAHLGVAGEEDEGAASRDFEEADGFFGGLLEERWAARIGEVLGDVEERLLLIVEVAGHDERARELDSEALLDEVEGALHGERGGRHYYAGDAVEELFGEERGDVDGRGLGSGSPRHCKDD